MEYWREMLPQALRELYAATKALGGKISGEHGIGVKRKAYMLENMDPAELGLMKAIKQAWDPNQIMNPGKIFDMA